MSFSSFRKGGLCKGARAQSALPSRSFLGGGNLGNISELRPSHAATPRQELCNEASRAAGLGGKTRGRLPQCQLFSSLGDLEARRRGQDGRDPDGPESRPRKPRCAAGRGEEERLGAVPSPRQGPTPRAPPDSTQGRRPRGAGGRAGTAAAAPPAAAAGKSGLALSVRAPGLPAAPSPTPAGRLALSGCVTQPSGYAEVCAEARNLPGRRRRPAAPAPPSARPGLRAAVTRGARAGRAPRAPDRRSTFGPLGPSSLAR